ncbi:MAG: GNAT family N-acetyltransferase [Chloroflexi bacterium]|nr:GNAT family N-acetyltransferase [Chloroflexota bacterium]
MPANIRQLTVKDKPALMQILHNTPEFKPAEVTIAEELIDCHLDDPDGSGYHILVADVNSKIAGYICWGPTPLTEGTWDIYWIAVAREVQSKGTGKALLAAAEDKIKKSRGRLILIETSGKPEYEKTRQFYLARGYDTVSLIPDFYAPGDDLLTLQKRLTP